MPDNINLFPEELRRALACLSDETRQIIVSGLMRESECAHKELLDKLKISKGNLNHHLSELMKAGIAINYSKEKFGSPYESFYAISDFGRDFISGVFNALKPNELPVRIQNTGWQLIGAATVTGWAAAFIGLEPSQQTVAQPEAQPEERTPVMVAPQIAASTMIRRRQ